MFDVTVQYGSEVWYYLVLSSLSDEWKAEEIFDRVVAERKKYKWVDQQPNRSMTNIVGKSRILLALDRISCHKKEGAYFPP